MFSMKKRKAGASDGETVSMHSLDNRKVERGRLFSSARLVNRIAEESTRQLVSWGNQLAGRLVVYDRHFLFDYWQPTGRWKLRLSDRLHLWFLRWVYPKPDMVIFLDAPSEVLLARKEEVPAKYLDKRRAAVLDAGRLVDRFEVVDASRPFDEVLSDVLDIVEHVRPDMVTAMSRGPR